MNVILKGSRNKNILRLLPAARCSAFGGKVHISAAPSKATRMRCRVETVGIGLAWRRETPPDDSK